MRGEPFAGVLAKPRPRVLDKGDRQRDEERVKRVVDAEVDARDGKRCRCCSRRGNPNALTTLGKIHRAHIKDASLIGAYVPKNICSLCWICHALVHTKALFFKGRNANRFPMKFEIKASVVGDVFSSIRILPAYVTVLKGQ